MFVGGLRSKSNVYVWCAQALKNMMPHLRVDGVDDDEAEVAEQAGDVQAANGVADLVCFRHAGGCGISFL